MPCPWPPRRANPSTARTHRMSSRERSQLPDQPGRVLVVNDNEALRRLLRLELQTAGFEVHEAATHLDLERHLRVLEPDALLLDLQRSAIDGLDLLLRLRARQTLREVPIVLLATCDDDDFGGQAMRAGADWFALRPLGMPQLRTQLADLIRHRRPLADDDVGQLAWHDDDALHGPSGYVRLNAG